MGIPPDEAEIISDVKKGAIRHQEWRLGFYLLTLFCLHDATAYIQLLLDDPRQVQSLIVWALAASFFSIATTWFIHLVIPGICASQSSDYASLPWLNGKRGFLQFFSISYNMVLNSKGLFRNGYEKVASYHLSLSLLETANQMRRCGKPRPICSWCRSRTPCTVLCFFCLRS